MRKPLLWPYPQGQVLLAPQEVLYKDMVELLKHKTHYVLYKDMVKLKHETHLAVLQQMREDECSSSHI